LNRISHGQLLRQLHFVFGAARQPKSVPKRCNRGATLIASSRTALRSANGNSSRSLWLDGGLLSLQYPEDREIMREFFAPLQDRPETAAK
jgi:hypothetical protein